LCDPYLNNPDATLMPQPWVKWAYEPARAEDVPAAFMRAYAVADPEIRAYVRAKFERLRQAVADLAGVAPADTWGFFGDGMLFNVVAMLEFDWVFPE